MRRWLLRRGAAGALFVLWTAAVLAAADFLLLDEILGLLDYGIATEEALEEILKLKDDSMHIILTGRVLPEGLRKYADSVTTLTTELLHCDKQ